MKIKFTESEVVDRNYAIELQCEEVKYVYKDLVCVKYKDGYNLIRLNSKNGQPCPILDKNYFSIDEFKDDLAIISKGMADEGIITYDGVIVHSQESGYIKITDNRLCYIKKGYSDKEQMVLITKNNTMSIPYDHIEYLGNGYYLIRDNNKMGIIDIEGNEIIPCLYKDIYGYNGKDIAIVEIQDKKGCISWFYRFSRTSQKSSN